jgi:predicted DNA-binding antitoxin AbrB/MazE fold protein
MDGSIDAIWDGEVFNPVTPIPLADGTRVKVTFETIDPNDIEGDRREAFLAAEQRLVKAAGSSRLEVAWTRISWVITQAA